MLVVAIAACASERELPDPQPATGVHPSGILDEASENFHGKELARRGYDLALCAKCHGDDFSGGAAQATCRNCHPAGPDACVTCHREGPTTGAHVVHRAAGQECAECHVVPARWDAEGHVLNDPTPAEVVFGPRAGAGTYADGTCSNVYCHGATLQAGGGSLPNPRWDATPVGGCGTCHGAPPPSHAQNECTSCHKDAPHLDGTLQVGAACNSCHGDATQFRDLAGSTLTGQLGAGAHQAHLSGTSRLRGPLACSDCHTTPTAVTDAGHIDSPLPAEVFPSTATLARTAGAVPQWDRASATCGDVYCHGGGSRFAGDTSPGLLRTPVWTGGDAEVYCGSCHGVPPTTHAPNLTIFDCATCHPSVDAFGNPIFTGSTSRHLDGVVDVL